MGQKEKLPLRIDEKYRSESQVCSRMEIGPRWESGGSFQNFG